MRIKNFLYNFQFGVRDKPVEDLMVKYCDEDSKFIEIDGLDVHYKDQGKGPVLLLIHGVVASLHTWDGWYEELKDHYRIIRIDMPGFGITGPNKLFAEPIKEHEHLIESILEFLDSFLDEVGIDRCHIAGNSLGGFYAWNYAVHRPDRVEKLILLDPIAYNQSLPYIFWLSNLPGVSYIIKNFGLPRFFIQDNLKRLYGKKERITCDLCDRYWELTMRSGNRDSLMKVFKTIAELSKSDTVYQEIKNIKTPVLMAWGTKDIWSRWKETLGHWKKDLPHAELIMYEGCGHMPMEEIPEISANDAHNFLLKDSKALSA